MAREASTGSIARATGTPWAEWERRLEAAGGPSLDHKALVAAALPHLRGLDNPGWWAQSVAVAYEQRTGRRAPGQAQDGTFEVSVSRTMPGSLDDALAAWEASVASRETYGGLALSGAPTTTATGGYRRWRATLEDGTRLLMQASMRGEKVVLSLTWSRLEDADRRARCRDIAKELIAAV